MKIDQLRRICLAFPGATEQIQWEDDLLFKVGGKMFALTPLEPSRLWLCLKADPEEFAELTDRPGIIPAPYLARAKWIAIESAEAVLQSEVERLLRKSYDWWWKSCRGRRVRRYPRINARGNLPGRKCRSEKRRGADLRTGIVLHDEERSLTTETSSGMTFLWWEARRGSDCRKGGVGGEADRQECVPRQRRKPQEQGTGLKTRHYTA